MINYLYQEQNWQSQLSDLITDPLELLHALQLSPEQLLSGAVLASEKFKLRVPRAFVAKMCVGDPLDPLLLQVLPHHLELEDFPGFVTDPLGEEATNLLPGVLHKYKTRFLLTLTAIKNYILSQPEVHEIILSGGDPLTLSNRKLGLWLERLESIPQIDTLRIHSRVPIVIPDRIDHELISLLENSRLRIILVVHSNHASELDDFTCSKLHELARRQVTVLNQAVLLKGINDSAEVLINLSYRLFEARVMPYYLHVLDKVKGAHHFDLPSSKIDEVYKEVLASLPGYLVPKLVREIAGEKNKTPLFGTITI